MNKVRHIFLLAAVFSLSVSCSRETRPAEELAERILGDKSEMIRFEVLKCEEGDVYELEEVRGHVVIRGNNSNSMAVGLNRYLQDYCLAQVTWYDYNPVELPDVLPSVPEKVRVENLLPYRFLMNYCTYGYTLAFWQWEQWERFIDWMALNGINMPLALTGQEAVWQKVWRKHGMTDDQIRSYFTGPAHLPWHRMNNIDHWQGPLPQEWIDGQAELQKKILKRERELGMHPVLPAFAGHVPGVLSSAMGVELNTTAVSNWCGFGDSCRCTFLNPSDPHFAEIQREYVSEQTAMYGTDHIYSLDAFNEVDVPVWDTTSLAAISRNLYNSLESADPDAVWLQMAWMFQSFGWNEETIKAYLTAVPKGRLIMLDYVCDYRSFWKETAGFYGQDFIWCYLGNFGGATVIEGNIHENSKNIDDCFANAGPSFKGIGSALEGFGVNEPLYEHVLSRAWNAGQDVEAYIDNIADRRLGRKDSTYRAFWHYMDEHVRMQHDCVDHTCAFGVRPDFTYHNGLSNYTSAGYDRNELVKAERILDAVTGNSDALAFDRVNTHRQVIRNMAEPALKRFNDAYVASDRNAMMLAKDDFLALMDSLLATVETRAEFSMDQYLEDARSWAADDLQRGYYETNARTILSVWGDTPAILDYCSRDLDGLVRNYYKPRWQMFFDAVLDAFDHNRQVEDLDDVFWDFECGFAAGKK